jgi:O-antigen ligase
MTTDTLPIPINWHRAALLFGLAGAVLVVLASSFTWIFFLTGALAILWISATENESFLLAMIFMVPFQWRLESGLPVASAVRAVVVVGFFLGRLLRFRMGARELVQRPMSLASLCYLAAGVASLIFGKPGWMEGAPEGIARLASYVGFYFVIIGWVDTEERLRRVLGVIMTSTIVVAAFAFVQQMAGGNTSFWTSLNPGVVDVASWQGRPPSFLDTPNNLAFYLNLILPLGLACWWMGNAGQKRLGALTFCSGSVALFLTQSRGGLVALGLTVLLAVFGLVKGRGKQLVLLAGLCLLTFLMYLAGSVLSPEHLGAIEDTSSLGRIILWATAWNIFADSPLFGAGLWNFHLLYREYFQVSWLPPMILGTHNMFLQLLSETGLCGFVAFLGLVIIAIRNALRLQRSSDQLGRLLGFAALWSFCSLLIHGLVESPLENPQIGTMLWILFALIAAKNRLDSGGLLARKKQAPASPFNGLAALGS